VNGTVQGATTPAEQPKGRTNRVLPAPQYLTQIQICRRLGICVETWRNWRKAGFAPTPAPLPGRPRWTVADIVRFEQGGSRYFTAHRRANQRVARALNVHDVSVVAGEDGR
jgi:hypothetical protein